MRARITGVSVRGAMFSGAVAGFVFGLFLGALLGALASWFAGAVVDWERQLGFSLGVTQQLLPFGDQVSALQPVADNWYLVVPAGALFVGLVAAVIGSLAGGLWAVLLNRGLTHIEVTVSTPDPAPVRPTVIRALPDRRARNRRRAAGR